MSIPGTGTFKFKKWDEKPYTETEGARKLAYAMVENSFSGDIQGESSLVYVMFYKDENGGSFMGLENIDGSVGGRKGSFVLEHRGTWDTKEGFTVRTVWSVVPGSSTGELRGLRGEGNFVSRQGEEETAYTLDYDFE